MEKCPRCKQEYPKYPLWEEYEVKKIDNKLKAVYNKQSKKVIKNWIMPDTKSILFMFLIFLTLWGVYDVMGQCKDAFYKPCKFCFNSGCFTPSPSDYKMLQTENVEDADLYLGIIPYDWNLKPLFLWAMIITGIVLIINLAFLARENKDKFSKVDMVEINDK